jgi:tRNA/tmRNA/rRNA uracil-C5-methylase (TrmA/RlmC/RlmD family)
VARHEGRVVFVRHALPGERVVAQVTEGGEASRFLRADAVEVLEASPDRVAPPCPYAGPGRCGGCDWQHAGLAAQRRLKAEVVAEQLHRLAGLDRDVLVEPVPGDEDGLRWRTRVQFAVDAEGRAGLRRHRSHEIVPVDDCRIAGTGVLRAGVTEHRWPPADAVDVVASSSGERAVLVHLAEGSQRRPRLPRLDPDVSVLHVEGRGEPVRVRGRTYVTEHAAGRDWRVGVGGFWQVHPGAADALVEAVLDGLQPRPGESALDLYCGAGLFAGSLAPRLGPQGRVTAVEADRRAVADARRNLHEVPTVALVAGRVDRVLGGPQVPGSADLVVLDPPRSGAGARVVRQVVARRPRAVGYVACDPAALARDLATFAGEGYRLRSLRAFDLFPMTHHVECVAVLVPAGGPAGDS